MTPGEVAALVRRYGETLTLKRTGQTDLTVKGRVSGAREGQLVAGLAEYSRIVTISNAEIAAAAWPGPPKKGDILVSAGTYLAVLAVETRRISDAAALHVMAVKG